MKNRYFALKSSSVWIFQERKNKGKSWAICFIFLLFFTANDNHSSNIKAGRKARGQEFFKGRFKAAMILAQSKTRSMNNCCNILREIFKSTSFHDLIIAAFSTPL